MELRMATFEPPCLYFHVTPTYVEAVYKRLVNSTPLVEDFRAINLDNLRRPAA
jgi:hypothetical protein